MIFGDKTCGSFRIVMTLWAAILLAVVSLVAAPQGAVAQESAAEVPQTTSAPAPAPAAAPVAETAPATAAEAAPAAEGAAADAAAPAEAASTYKPLGSEWFKGQPVDRGITVQEQYSPIGEYASGLHIGLVYVMGAICLFILALLLWVIVRYRRGANPVPSKTTHNTLIEVVWTLVPVLVLVGIAIPSITLLSRQYVSPPKDAVTIKAIGHQWQWYYEYPDNDITEDTTGPIISNMLLEKDEVEPGKRFRTDEDGPRLLAVDNRMVVPANTPLRIQVAAADVIHSFAVPSLWFKIDAVPGRLNERLLTINEPGVYFGQCSELCGVKHGYMPIVIEALPRAEWEAWVKSKGGSVGAKKAEAAPAAPAAPAPAAAPAAEGAPAASAAAPAPAN